MEIQKGIFPPCRPFPERSCGYLRAHIRLRKGNLKPFKFIGGEAVCVEVPPVFVIARKSYFGVGNQTMSKQMFHGFADFYRPRLSRFSQSGKKFRFFAVLHQKI